jgi:hypothetical protein
MNLRKSSGRFVLRWDKEGDGRRKYYLKRKITSLERDNDFLAKLVETLRESGEEEALHCLRLIRSSASLGEIRQRLTRNHNPIASQEVTLQSLTSSYEVQETPVTQKDIRRIMDLKRLMDVPR